MFGYIKPYKPEMKIKEYEMYKGIYCSLCKQLGKSYGVFSRLILNYDFTFLAICLMATKEKECRFEKSHCTFCYSKKCVSCKVPDVTLEYVSAISIITAYYKVKDNYEDGSILKKIGNLLLLPYFKIKYNKAEKSNPEIAKIIKNQMNNQKLIEGNLTSSIDRAADATAKAMGEIVSFGFNETDKEILYRFGYCLGRFVYLCDALDDLEKDTKSDNYNVFLTDKNKNFNDIRKSAFSLLDTTADELAKAYELINFNRYKSILDNIVYYGLDVTIDKVLRKEETKNEKSI